MHVPRVRGFRHTEIDREMDRPTRVEFQRRAPHIPDAVTGVSCSESNPLFAARMNVHERALRIGGEDVGALRKPRFGKRLCRRLLLKPEIFRPSKSPIIHTTFLEGDVCNLLFKGRNLALPGGLALPRF